MKLKHEGEEFAVCSYTCGAGSQDTNSLPFSEGTQKEFTPSSFKRRAYWLKNEPNYVFVHYIDESIKYYQQ